MDYIFPLPPADLHRRYDGVFSGFKKGLSVCLIGLPQSARSGYLKFILEYESGFLSEFIDPQTYHFIVIDDPSLTADQLVNSIAVKIISLDILPPGPVSQLEKRLRMADPHLVLIALKSALTAVYPKHKFVLVLYEAEKLLHNRPQAINFIKSLWDTNRNQPDSQVSLCFIGSPLLLELKNSLHWSPLRPALEETTVYFPLFSTREVLYLRHRLEFFSGLHISPVIHTLASRLSGGHTVLYRLLTQLSAAELVNLANVRHHPSVDSLLAEIWSGIPGLIRQNWTKDYPFYIPLLPPPSTLTETVNPGFTLPVLTAQQKLLFNYLISHQEQIISRDDLAQVLWGKLWQQKYSDWAIDQTVSKLKKKLSLTDLSLTVIRNRGYLLTRNK